VPLVKDRAGYLRVFVVANRTNVEMPVVRVRMYNTANPIGSTVLIQPQGSSVPTAVDESSLSFSWNTPVAGTLIQPGFQVEAEVDPAGLIMESDEGDNLLALSAPEVRTMPSLNVTLVPVVQAGLTGNVTNSNKDQFLSVARNMYPVAGMTSVVGSPLVITEDTLQAQNGNEAWGNILWALDLKRVTEHGAGHYYGVAKVSYTSGVAGVAYVSDDFSERSALGWDYLPTGAAVAAHELGHNWSRNHAPCGGPNGLDPSYPFADGRIGVYGVDVGSQTLVPAATSDIMGYCEPKWIGAYTYRAVMDHLLSPPPTRPAPVVTPVLSDEVQLCLVVSGHIRNGELVLEPAFQVNTRPRMPRRSGSYSVEALAEDGSKVFSLSFTPSRVADGESEHQSFVFAVPISRAQVTRLHTLRLAGPGGQKVRSRTQPAAPQLGATLPPDSARVRRVAGGKVGVRWDARRHPLVMVRDVETGEVLSFARGGSVDVVSRKRELELVFSDGVQSRVKRVAVQP
jgi:hypothetical protein